MQNTFECVLSARYGLTAYRKFIRKADIPQCPEFRDNIQCRLVRMSTGAKVAFLRMLRHFYVYGGNWPVFDVPRGITSALGLLIGRAQELKREGLSWGEAKKRLEARERELAFFVG